MSARVLLAAGQGLRFLLGWAVTWLRQVLGFVAAPADELVTAWLGVAPMLPRLRRWRHRLGTEWRAYRAGAIDGEVMDGVWR